MPLALCRLFPPLTPSPVQLLSPSPTLLFPGAKPREQCYRQQRSHRNRQQPDSAQIPAHLEPQLEQCNPAHATFLVSLLCVLERTATTQGFVSMHSKVFLIPLNSNCQIGPVGAAGLCSFLYRNKHITMLDLRNAFLGARGTKTLSR